MLGGRGGGFSLSSRLELYRVEIATTLYAHEVERGESFYATFGFNWTSLSTFIILLVLKENTCSVGWLPHSCTD